MEAVRSMMGFMKFQDGEKKYINEILSRLLNRAANISPEITETPETTEIPEISSTNPSNDLSRGVNSPHEDSPNEDETVPVVEETFGWNKIRKIGKTIVNSPVLKSTLRGLLYLLGAAIVIFNIFILIALIHSADLPDKNPLCQPTASTGYSIRDWVDETGEKVKYQMWKFNQWFEAKSNTPFCSCPECPECPESSKCPVPKECPACPVCPACPACPVCPKRSTTKEYIQTYDLQSIPDNFSSQKGIIL